jgi:transporter family-2 protein
MKFLLALIAALTGAGLTIQVGMNAAVRAALGSPLLAALVNFLVGLVALVVLTLLSGVRWPSAASLAGVPAWAWLAGLLGVNYIVATTVLGPRLGAAALIALTVLGQMLAALLVDHYGVLGFPQSTVTPARLLGAVLLVVGVLLIVRR